MLQYSRRRNEFLAKGVDVYMVSIGKPEIGE